MKLSLALASLAALLPVVLGHGSMTNINIDGTDYPGPQPNGAQVDSVIRQINSIDPINDSTKDDMSCGNGAAGLTATKMAAAKPGSKITVSWISGSPPTPWPHVVGPLLTYIASCNGDCAKFKSTDAKWVKIDQASLVNGNTVAGSGWVQEATFHQNKTYSMNLPSDTPPGNYLLRHEIIALHNAQSVGGAEFYPACSQITVAGGASSSASSSKTLSTDSAVSFPGGYSPTDPGIHVDVFSPPFGQYQFPGPDVVTSLVTGATASNNTNSGSSSGTSQGGSGSSGGSSAASTTAASSLTPTTTKPATTATHSPASNSTGAGSSGDNGDCNDDDSADNGSDDGSTVTITETVYVTATPGAQQHTTTKIVTLTTDAPSSAASPTASAANLDSASDAYRRRRSRIMARHHFASVH